MINRGLKVWLFCIGIVGTMGDSAVAQDPERVRSMDVVISTYESSIRKLNAQFVELAEKELVTANDKINLLTKHYLNNANSERDKLVEKLQGERERLKAEDRLAEALKLDEKIASLEKQQHFPPVSGVSLLYQKNSDAGPPMSPAQKKLEALQRQLLAARDEASMLPKDREFISRLKGSTYQVVFTSGSGTSAQLTFNPDGSVSAEGKAKGIRWGVIADRLVAVFNPKSGGVDIYHFNDDLTECGCYGAGRIRFSKKRQPGVLVGRE